MRAHHHRAFAKDYQASPTTSSSLPRFSKKRKMEKKHPRFVVLAGSLPSLKVITHSPIDACLNSTEKDPATADQNQSTHEPILRRSADRIKKIINTLTIFNKPVRLVTLLTEECAHLITGRLVGISNLRVRIRFHDDEGTVSGKAKTPAQAIALLASGTAAQVAAIGFWFSTTVIPSASNLWTSTAPMMDRFAGLNWVPFLLGSMMVIAHAVRLRASKIDRQTIKNIWKETRATMTSLFQSFAYARPIAAHSSWIVWMKGDGKERLLKEYTSPDKIDEDSGMYFSGDATMQQRKIAVLKQALHMLTSRDALVREFFYPTQTEAPMDIAQQPPRFTLRIMRNIAGPNGNFVLSRQPSGTMAIELDESALLAEGDSEIACAATIAASEIYHACLHYLLEERFKLRGVDEQTREAFALVKQVEFLRLTGQLDAACKVIERHEHQLGLVAQTLMPMLNEYREVRNTKGSNEQELVKEELNVINKFLMGVYAGSNYSYNIDRQQQHSATMLLHLGNAYKSAKDYRNALRQYSHALMFVPHDPTLRRCVIDTLHEHIDMMSRQYPEIFKDFDTIWRTPTSSITEMWDMVREVTLIDELKNIPESASTDGIMASRFEQVEQAVLFFDFLETVTATHPRIDQRAFYQFLQERRITREPLNNDTIDKFIETYFTLTRDDRGDKSNYNDQTRKILWLSAILLPYSRVLHGDESLDAWEVLPRLLFRFFPQDIQFPIVNQVMALTTLHRNYGTIIFGEGSPAYTDIAFPEVDNRLKAESRKHRLNASSDSQSTEVSDSLVVNSQRKDLVQDFLNALDAPDVFTELNKWRSSDPSKSKLFQLFPNLFELSQMPKYRVRILDHVFELIRYSSLIEQGTDAAYREICSRKEGRLLTSTNFRTFHQAFKQLVGPEDSPDYRMRRRFVYMLLLFHDLGESQTIKHPDFNPGDPHEIKGSVLFPEIVHSLESVLGGPGTLLHPEDVKRGAWLISKHVDLGTLHFGERSLHCIIPPDDKRDPTTWENIGLLAYLNTMDVFAIYGGEPLSQEKGRFFAELVANPESIEHNFGQDIFDRRIRSFSSDGKGVLKPACYKQVMASLDALKKTYKHEYESLRRNFGDPGELQVLNYAIFFLQALKAEDLVKLLFIISQVKDALSREVDEEGKPRPLGLHWIEFTAKSAEAPFAAEPLCQILKKYSFKKIAELGRLSAQEICDHLEKDGIPFRFEQKGDAARLYIDNKKLSDFSRYVRLAALGAASWVVAKKRPVLTNYHIGNYAFLHSLTKVSLQKSLASEWPKIRLYLGLFGRGRNPIDLEESVSRFTGKDLIAAARDPEVNREACAQEFEAIKALGDLDGFEGFLREINIKNGIWNLRAMANLNDASVIRLLYAFYLLKKRYEEDSAGTQDKKGVIRVLKFSHELNLRAPDEVAVLQRMVKGMAHTSCAELRQQLCSEEEENRFRTLSFHLGLVGMGIQIERSTSHAPDTLLVTLIAGTTTKRQNRYILDIFGDAQAARDPAKTGGKGSSLAILQAIPGILVPEGFIVTTDAYEAFVGQDQKLVAMIDELDRVSIQWIQERAKGRKAKLEALEKTINEQASLIRARMAGLDLPKEVEEEVRAGYLDMAKYFRQLSLSVAVRSSSVAEDTLEASFAGQQETFLNQIGEEQVLASLKDCFISSFGDRAISYRNSTSFRLLPNGEMANAENIRFTHKTARMAVVIQRMIDGTAAGVAFSINLKTGGNGVTLSANYGLGESVVQGIVTPDQWLFASDGKDRLTLELARKGAKKIQVVPQEGGGVSEEAVSEEDRKRFVFTPDRAREIAERIQKIQAHYAAKRGIEAVDAEFVNDPNGTLYFVQARPETVFSKFSGKETVRTLRPIPGRKPLCDRGVTGWPGVGIGRLVCINLSMNPSEEEISKANAAVHQGDILAINKTVPSLALALERVGGLIVEEGGDASHAAIVAREKGIPAILGASGILATLSIHANTVVSVDATACKVFSGLSKDSDILEMSRKAFEAELYSESTIDKKIKDIEAKMGNPKDRTRLGRPSDPMPLLQAHLYEEAFRETAERLNFKLSNDLFIEPAPSGHGKAIFETTLGRMNNKLFNALRKLSLEDLEKLLNDRIDVVRELQQVIMDFDPDKDSPEAFLKTYRTMISYFHFRWVFARHLDWRYQKDLRDTPEEKRPYDRDFTQSCASDVTDIAGRKAQAFRDIQDDLVQVSHVETFQRTTAGMLESSEEYKKHLDDLASSLSHSNDSLVGRLVDFGKTFPITDDVDMSQEPPDLTRVLRFVLPTLTQKSEVPIDTEGGVFSELKVFKAAGLLARQVAQSELEHVLQIRCQFQVREKLLRLGERLVEAGLMETKEQVFEVEPAALIRVTNVLNGAV